MVEATLIGLVSIGDKAVEHDETETSIGNDHFSTGKTACRALRLIVYTIKEIDLRLVAFFFLKWTSIGGPLRREREHCEGGMVLPE